MYRTRKQPKKSRRQLAIDFDGVIHRYSRGFHDGSLYDLPMPGSRKVLGLLRKKWWIYVYTTRAQSRSGQRAVERWLRKHKIPFDEVVSKKPVAFAYIDDRAIHFDDWPQAMKALKEMGRRHQEKAKEGA